MPVTHPGPVRLSRLGTNDDSPPYERFALAPLSPTIGAEIEGLDLRQPLDPDLQQELNRALLEWKVLFFRDQSLDSAQHRDLAANWGPLEVHPFLPEGDIPEVVRFTKGADGKGYENVWHSDVSWREIPSLGSILKAVEVPTVGGDTLWCDMYAAYEGLPDHVRARIDNLSAVHDFSRVFGRGMGPDELAAMQEKYPPVEHPVVRTHPETGRRLLYVNGGFTTHLVRLEPDEGKALLRRLLAESSMPEYQCRFHWTPGAVAFWDNRSTQHYACSDYYPSVRVMERATIIGDRPA